MPSFCGAVNRLEMPVRHALFRNAAPRRGFDIDERVLYATPTITARLTCLFRSYIM